MKMLKKWSPKSAIYTYTHIYLYTYIHFCEYLHFHEDTHWNVSKVSYIYTNIYMYTYIYFCEYLHYHKDAQKIVSKVSDIYTNIYIYLYTYIHFCQYLHFHKDTRWNVSKFSYIYTHIYLHIYIHIHIFVSIFISIKILIEMSPNQLAKNLYIYSLYESRHTYKQVTAQVQHVQQVHIAWFFEKNSILTVACRKLSVAWRKLISRTYPNWECCVRQSPPWDRHCYCITLRKSATHYQQIQISLLRILGSQSLPWNRHFYALLESAPLSRAVGRGRWCLPTREVARSAVKFKLYVYFHRRWRETW